MSTKIENISLLFDRPNEPLYVPKGDNNIIFQVPGEYLPTNAHDVSQRNNFSGPQTSTVNVPLIKYPELPEPLKLPRDVQFTTFNPVHRSYAAQVISVFMRVELKHLMPIAISYRDRMNPQLFTYALSVALLHRQDTKEIQIPLFSQIFPDKFIGSNFLNGAKREANIAKQGSRIPLEIPYDFTATDVDQEHRIAYFREDVGINLHHWHWHLIYPFDGPDAVVRKDRRGELFYYMHHQIIARYNVERLCNGLEMVVPLTPDDLNKPLPEAYFPKMDQSIAGRNWPSRPANTRLSNVSRLADWNNTIQLGDFKTYQTRIEEAIKNMRVRNRNNQEVVLDEVNGIDILGNIIEASPVLSPNMQYYGDLHNSGHIAIAYCHDPDQRYLEPASVMGDPTTAMRDPAFYRWHSFIDNIFDQFKRKLSPYTQQQLKFDSKINLKVENVSISSPNANPNTLITYWTKSSIDISYGLDFAPRGALTVLVQHLNHNAFEYRITVNNPGSAAVTGTVRIFVAPKYKRNRTPFTFDEQRLLMVEMDKFTTTIGKGRSEIKRSSTESALAIPFEAVFRDQTPRPEDAQRANEFNFCGCGWPQYMLVPKGHQQGFSMDLFVMITDYNKDKVIQLDDPVGCRTGVSFCGLRDRKYPDARAMGFPFDRAASSNVISMDQFLTPNMKLQPITVRFANEVRPRQTTSAPGAN